MMRILPALLLILSSGAHAAPENFPTKAPLRFLMVGDTGTGAQGQLDVAKAMKKVCDERGCQFALAAGDNIYEYGPSSANDSQFNAKFETPYAALGFPFLMALGNHDQSGPIPGSGVHPEKGDFEVAYSAKSKRWFMPERYYRIALPVTDAGNFRSSIKSPLLEVFVLDSNPLAPQNRPPFDWYRPDREYDKKQRQWLRDSLSASKARWKIVLAHHPYLNNGKHGGAGDFFGLGLSTGAELKNWYEQDVCGKADLLVSGHDHSLQWLKPAKSCGTRPQFIISGAGSKKYQATSSHKYEANWEAYDTLGFFWAQADEKQLQITAYVVKDEAPPTKVFEGKIRKEEPKHE